ncbi:outer membrane beta-barrel protein [Vibrio hepatarius]|uniref:outer membrane beta-barrel protein n=1 Tax=Vibrio hepatarius TaxID=171383 RepID=UPI001C08B090|nr:outer membrane beta-barrel protein [Vibrio hepatarius]MBU2898555.1 porin family protein [Vibrio hepatarius]
MKKAVLAAFVAAASFQAVGVENIGAQHGYLDEGWYIGADIIDTDMVTEGEYSKSSEVSSVSAAVSVGYNLRLSDSVILGIEGEYADYGKFDVVFPAEPDLKGNMDIQSLTLYLKPKLFLADSPFYVGPIVGFGRYKADINVQFREGSKIEYNSVSDSETEFTYGLEAGYAFDRHVFINAGYRTVDIDGTDLDTLYAGIDYKF